MCSRSLRGAVLPPGGYVLALSNPLHPCKALVTLWVMLHSQRCLDPNALLQNYNSPSWGPVKAKGPGLAGCLLQLPPGLQCAACFRVWAPVVCPEADPAPRSLKSANPGKWWQFWASVEALAQFQGCLSLYRPCKGPPCLSSCKTSIPGLTRASTHLSIKICETLSPEENIYSLELPLVHYFPTPSFLASRRCLTSRMTTLLVLAAFGYQTQISSSILKSWVSVVFLLCPLWDPNVQYWCICLLYVFFIADLITCTTSP